jgi:hypothetical protein
MSASDIKLSPVPTGHKTSRDLSSLLTTLMKNETYHHKLSIRLDATRPRKNLCDVDANEVYQWREFSHYKFDDKQQQLLSSCKKDDKNHVMDLFMEHSHDIFHDNACNLLNSSLMIACNGGHINIIQLLLKLCGGVKFDIMSGFRHACHHNHSDAAKIMFDLLPKTEKRNACILSAFIDAFKRRQSILSWMLEIPEIFNLVFKSISLMCVLLYALENESLDLIISIYNLMNEQSRQKYVLRLQLGSLFEHCCSLGKVDLCKWIMQDEDVFASFRHSHDAMALVACKKNRTEMFLWLMSMPGTKWKTGAALYMFHKMYISKNSVMARCLIDSDKNIVTTKMLHEMCANGNEMFPVVKKVYSYYQKAQCLKLLAPYQV